MEYFFWSNAVVWAVLAVYALHLRARAASLGRKLASGGRGGDG